MAYRPAITPHTANIGRTVTDQEEECSRRGRKVSPDQQKVRRLLPASSAACSRFHASHCAMPPPPQVLALGGAAAAVGIGYALHRAHERAASDAARADEARMNEELNRNRERSAEAKQVRRRSAGPVSNHQQV